MQLLRRFGISPTLRSDYPLSLVSTCSNGSPQHNNDVRVKGKRPKVIKRA